MEKLILMHRLQLSRYPTVVNWMRSLFLKGLNRLHATKVEITFFKFAILEKVLLAVDSHLTFIVQKLSDTVVSLLIRFIWKHLIYCKFNVYTKQFGL